jgi:hypothetical protein
MTLQGDFMILTILNDTSFYRGVRFLSAKIGRAECTSLRSLRSPSRTLRLKILTAKGCKDNAKAAKQSGTPVTTGRDQQSSKHWRHIAGTAYNSAATFFFLN